MRGAGTAVIVGGGLLGLEAAYYLAQLDVRVLVLDRGPWPLSRQLDEQAGALLWEMLGALGIEVLARTEARQVLAGEQATGVELIDGGSIDAELCLIATGIVPNAELAAAAGLEVDGGISVDDGMHTSDPHIFAVGRRRPRPPPVRALAGVRGAGPDRGGEHARRRGGVPRRGDAGEAQGAGDRSALRRRRRRRSG